MNKLPSYEVDPMVMRETLALVRAYHRIEDADFRMRVSEFIKRVGAAEGRDN